DLTLILKFSLQIAGASSNDASMVRKLLVAIVAALALLITLPTAPVFGAGGIHTDELQVAKNKGTLIHRIEFGTATLAGGTVVVSNPRVKTTSLIFVDSQGAGGTAGFVKVSARTAGTSFTILSSSGTDTSTVAW